jgi:lipid-A-disaccharide synthase-like uncharacterized protein
LFGLLWIIIGLLTLSTIRAERRDGHVVSVSWLTMKRCYRREMPIRFWFQIVVYCGSGLMLIGYGIWVLAKR